jgi:type IV secretion system protein VirD4
VQRWVLAPVRGRREPELVGDPLETVRGAAARWGGGVYLGALSRGDLRFARAERAVLLLGPPRSGKTSGVIIPAVLSHEGPVVSTSIKPDVWQATRGVRSGDGRVWVFDPTGSGARGGSQELRWSPVGPSRSLDGALLIARAMTTNIGARTTDRSHWSSRAQALLAPMLRCSGGGGV